MRGFFVAAIMLIVSSNGASAANDEGMGTLDAVTEARLKSLLASPHRDPQNKARDRYRHPLETLKFFGLTQDMTVMEIWPATGWWTEILAPLLVERGHYIAAQFDPAGPSHYVQMLSDFKAKIAADPARYGNVEIIAFEPTAPPVTSVDMVLTFRNIHNWMAQGEAKQWFAAMYKSLKPGGYLGVVEHRAAKDGPQDPAAENGYVREDFAIDLIESQGFELVAQSDINANPRDTKDYSRGVWSLPPSFAEGARDRAKYATIGESDRFTLLFRKPNWETTLLD